MTDGRGAFPMNVKKKPAGFTLLELMVVLFIVGVLAAIAQPAFQGPRLKAREATLKADLWVFRDLIDQYYADHGEYPESLEILVDRSYLRKVPVDPFTQSSESWTLLPHVEGESGIFDVRSGSDLTGSNDVPYSEW
jgi:general secretion pathway protein G